jgi:hypothetical protein
MGVVVILVLLDALDILVLLGVLGAPCVSDSIGVNSVLCSSSTVVVREDILRASDASDVLDALVEVEEVGF